MSTMTMTREDYIYFSGKYQNMKKNQINSSIIKYINYAISYIVDCIFNYDRIFIFYYFEVLNEGGNATRFSIQFWVN